MIIRDLLLLIRAPKEFVYSFTYPRNRYVTILPYDKATTIIGKDLVEKIKRKYPELTVHFSGSAVLGIVGQKDIDLFIECDKSELEKYKTGISKIVGQPRKVKKDFVEWSFGTRGCDVQVLLIDPNHPLYKKQINTQKVLENNRKILQEYEKMKLQSNGVLQREYARRKLKFFINHGL